LLLFFMVLRPPRSTLFPSRRSSDLAGHLSGQRVPNVEYPKSLISWKQPRPAGFGPIARDWVPRVEFAGTYDEKWEQERLPLLARSEEHTSELQSRENLVCRLLLEKK